MMILYSNWASSPDIQLWLSYVQGKASSEKQKVVFMLPL